MKTIGVTMWKHDFGRHFSRRVEHMLEKQGVDAWVFVVRRTNDLTADVIRSMEGQYPIVVAEESWGPVGDRMVRLSLAGDLGLTTAVGLGAERIYWQESDLVTPENVVGLLGETQRAVVGGWPVMAHNGLPAHLQLSPNSYTADSERFYDTWGYRLNGEKFTNEPPFHAGHPQESPFQVDSVGSAALIDADYVRRGARFGTYAFVELCRRVTALGGEVWCDPRVPVVQPLELWEFNDDD